jgi:predicted amidophosphoribosyltransferase
MLSLASGTFTFVLCVACTRSSPTALCPQCAGQTRRAPDRSIGDGLRVVAGAVHEGPSRALVHALKYRGVDAAVPALVDPLIGRVPAATALVPVPRAPLRAARYGVDPAGLIAGEIGRRMGIPVLHALQAPVWWPRHAAASRSERGGIRFRQRLAVPPGCALVDDVVTTGATVAAAARALHPRPGVVLAATVAPRVGAGSTPVEDA